MARVCCFIALQRIDVSIGVLVQRCLKRLREFVGEKQRHYSHVSERTKRGMHRQLEVQHEADVAYRARIDAMHEAVATAVVMGLPDASKGYAFALVSGLPEGAIQPEGRAMLLVHLRDSAADPIIAQRLVAAFPERVGHDDADAALTWVKVIGHKLEHMAEFRLKPGSRRVADRWRDLSD
jgi:hypothetical protein